MRGFDSKCLFPGRCENLWLLRILYRVLLRRLRITDSLVGGLLLNFSFHISTLTNGEPVSLSHLLGGKIFFVIFGGRILNRLEFLIGADTCSVRLDFR